MIRTDVFLTESELAFVRSAESSIDKTPDLDFGSVVVRGPEAAERGICTLLIGLAGDHGLPRALPQDAFGLSAEGEILVDDKYAQLLERSRK